MSTWDGNTWGPENDEDEVPDHWVLVYMKNDSFYKIDGKHWMQLVAALHAETDKWFTCTDSVGTTIMFRLDQVEGLVYWTKEQAAASYRMEKAYAAFKKEHRGWEE